MRKVNDFFYTLMHSLFTFPQDLWICARVTPKNQEKTMVIPRALPDEQMELFSGTPLYMTQSDVATFLNISVRVIQYWENQELLHPELNHKGRIRRYTKRDLAEIIFIKTMVEDHGYSVPWLKEKLAKLKAPYYYDAKALFWDAEDEEWKTRQGIAIDAVNAVKEPFALFMKQVLENVPGNNDKKAAAALLGLVRDLIRGKKPKVAKVGPARPRKSKKVPTTQSNLLTDDTSEQK